MKQFLISLTVGLVSFVVFFVLGRLRVRTTRSYRSTPILNPRIKIRPNGRPYVETKDLVERRMSRSSNRKGA